ncbi:MAG: hypothetical protein V4710_06560, partial [Verrucomicrobiota bacterium]
MPTKAKTIKPSAARKPAAKANTVASNGNKPSGKAPKYVYTWGNNKADGDGSMQAEGEPEQHAGGLGGF